jgi:hypothetical protein
LSSSRPSFITLNTGFLHSLFGFSGGGVGACFGFPNEKLPCSFCSLFFLIGVVLIIVVAGMIERPSLPRRPLRTCLPHCACQMMCFFRWPAVCVSKKYGGGGLLRACVQLYARLASCAPQRLRGRVTGSARCNGSCPPARRQTPAARVTLFKPPLNFSEPHCCT